MVLENQQSSTISQDQARDRLKDFLKRKNHSSVLELSGISPETFETIHRQTQDDADQFPGFENTRSGYSYVIKNSFT